jgi:hypothetical protein
VAEERKARYRDISDGLLRQRRNFLLISLLMPLFFLSGAAFEKINLLGTVILVKNPDVIKYSLVLLFSYFGLRYWQYYQEETYVKDMHNRIHEHLYYQEEKYLNKKAREKAKFLNSNFVRVCFSDPRYSRRSGRFTATPEKKDQVVFPFMRKCEFYIYPADDRQGHKESEIENFHSILSLPENSHWESVSASGTTDKPPYFYRQYLTYSILKFNTFRLLGGFRYMFSESYFTDYQLPFIVGVLSIVATVSAKFI